MKTFQLLISLILTLCTLACTLNVEQAEPAPVCAPVSACMTSTIGYEWRHTQAYPEGECYRYEYVCAPEGETASERCEVESTLVCDPRLLAGPP